MARKKPRHTPRSSAKSAQAPPSIPGPELYPLLVAALVFLVGCLYFMPFIPDDAYISYRYAEHLADGHGLTFNIGDRPVEAYSNLLWILVCAALAKLGMNLPAVTPWVGVVLGLGSLTVLWTLCRRRVAHPHQLYLPLILLALSGPFLLYAVSGMESALFALLLLLLTLYVEDFTLSQSRSTVVAMALTGLALALTRPEGVILLPAAVGFALWTRRTSPDRGRLVRGAAVALAAFAVVFVAYNAWRVSYFGEWLPTPFMSKGGEGESFFAGWQKNFRRYFLNWAYYSPPFGYYFLTLIGAGAAALGLPREEGGRSDGLPMFLALLLSAVYLNFVDWMPAMRYHAAIVALLLVPVCSLQQVVPAEYWRLSAPRARRRALVAMFVVVLFSVVGLNHLKIATAAMSQSQREALLPLGRWLRNTVPPDSWLAMSDVGAAPFVSGLRTIDIHRESLTDLHIAKGSFTAEYVLRKEPSVIALAVRGLQRPRMDPLHYSLYTDKRFLARYQFVGTVRHQWYEERSYWVFVRGRLNIDTRRLEELPIGVGDLHISMQKRVGAQ